MVEAPTIARITEFLPSVHGLRFSNTWPAASKVTVNVPLLGRLPVGTAAKGLCGGMVFTALDVFSAGQDPLDAGQPAPGSPLFDHIVRRLFDSWNLPGGVVKYYRWMVLPDGGVAGRTAHDEWPVIRAELDAGRPCPLGLVTVRSANPLRLGLNHQVLAYGYSAGADAVTVQVYDPNTDVAGADDVWIRLSTTDTTAPTAPSTPAIAHNVNVGLPVRGFFRVRYVAADPSRLAPTP